MIKIRPIHMDYDRKPELNDPSNFKKDESWLKTIDYFFIPNRDLIWKDLILSMDDNPDYYIVFGSLYNYKDNQGKKIEYFDESKAILFHVEPYALRSRFYANGYDLANFGTNFLKTFNILPLWTGCGMTYKQALESNIEKTKNLSAIISSTQSTQGHHKRLEFVRDYLSKMDMDHYGHEISNSTLFKNDNRYFKNYRGYLNDKSQGLVDYRYHYTIENTSEVDYITEKMLEAQVTECLPFYSGCPNIEKFINPDSFIKINLDNPKECYEIIQNAIANDEWSKRIDVIKESKNKIITELNIMNLVHNAINGVKNYFE